MDTELKKRLEEIDAAKGIGMILVIFGHTLLYGNSAFRWIFSFHMPLFFFLSGYTVQPEKYSNIKEYSIRKIKAFGKAYGVTVVLSMIITLLVPLWRNQLTIKSIVIYLYTGHPQLFQNGSVWFLLALCWANILYIILRRVCVWQSIKHSDIFIMLLAAVGMLAQKIWEFLISCFYSDIGTLKRWPWKLDSAVCGLFFIAFGHFAKQNLSISSWKTKLALITSGGVSLSFVGYGLTLQR